MTTAFPRGKWCLMTNVHQVAKRYTVLLGAGTQGPWLCGSQLQAGVAHRFFASSPVVNLIPHALLGGETLLSLLSSGPIFSCKLYEQMATVGTKGSKSLCWTVTHLPISATSHILVSFDCRYRYCAGISGKLPVELSLQHSINTSELPTGREGAGVVCNRNEVIALLKLLATGGPGEPSGCLALRLMSMLPHVNLLHGLMFGLWINNQ